MTFFLINIDSDYKTQDPGKGSRVLQICFIFFPAKGRGVGSHLKTVFKSVDNGDDLCYK